MDVAQNKLLEDAEWLQIIIIIHVYLETQLMDVKILYENILYILLKTNTLN